MAGGFGVARAERLGGADESGGGRVGSGSFEVSTALISSADGGGGSLAGAMMGAEVAMGKGTEGGSAGVTSRG